jgi:very-short-patch-repair endonuclease
MDAESAIDIHIDGGSQTRGIDSAIAALAERQHGVVARRQLETLGIGRGAIDRRIRCGRLRPIHHGVYGVGHSALSREGRWMAAVLASGPGAVLSHQSAAALWGLRPTGRASVDVTTPRDLRRRPGIHRHCAVLLPDEITTRNGIPITTPARTLLDLAAVLPEQAVRRAINEAEVLRLADATALHVLIARHPGHRGISKLRDHHPAPTRSELEARFLAFLAEAVLPRPNVNTVIEGVEVDFAWPNHRLIAELDGFAFHATRRAFEQDRARDRRLQAHGWRVVRITWRQLHDDPERLADELAALLGLRAT